MKKLIGRIRALKAFATLVKDPAQTDRVFALGDQIRAERGPLMLSTLEYIKARPGFEELYRSGYDPKIPTLQEMDRFPEGSFGKAFATHMLSRGLSVDFFPHVRGETEVEYLVERARKTHDFWHVLTGFDTDVPGEIGLQGFALAQLHTPFSALIIVAGVLHAMLREPAIFWKTIESLMAGYQMGKRARVLLTAKLEERLGESLEAVRAEMGLVPTAA